ncbi:hypothetical protein M407DRAFT_243288 [Tulasnella calospora MUT 4182]|uniref:Uncharacterized protein n=1 Tax=Tulasnella calospora MUT 4182 TaxID=1051891 RepID=A0A0C3QK40_9AGAM|nr:hypothetical protein M407DRAFT_243288 [Tulasnella calospora MUT 4182]
MESGDHREAEELLQEAISNARQRSMRHLLASSLWELGECLEEQSKLDEATAAFEEACTLYQEMSDQARRKRVARILVKLKSNQGDWERALFWHDHVIAACRSQRKYSEVADHLELKSRTLVEAQRFDEAALHLEAAIVIYKENESSWSWERSKLCAIPKTVMKWERRLPLLCDMKKLQRRLPHLFTTNLKLPIPINHGEL